MVGCQYCSMNTAGQHEATCPMYQPLNRMFEVKKCNCAAGPWNRDMSKALRDGREILLMEAHETMWVGMWEDDGWVEPHSNEILHPIAFAELRLPKEKP